MIKTLLATVALATAALFSACTAPAANAPANTNSNANAAKPTAAAPTADVLLDMEKKANEAYMRGDSTHFEGLLSEKAVMSMGKDRMGKAGIISMTKTVKCEGVAVNLSEPQITKIDNDTYAFTYKNDSTGKCNEGTDGAMTNLKPVRASTLWVRSGDKWQAAWHGETPIMSAPAADAKANANSSNANSATAKMDTKAADTAKATDTKKADAKPAANTSADANKPAPAALTPSANTDALAKLHVAGWEAFKAKDAKYFESNMTSTFAFVAPDGSYVASKADAIKQWTGAGTMKCEGITKVSFSEAFAVAVSPTVEILMGKGNSDGKCDGMANGDLWQTAVYVKEGDMWKTAFMTETPPMPAS
ncbi:MAG: nuclear transport factor 2 family protein [Pyrinomonadaceae bacterium]